MPVNELDEYLERKLTTRRKSCICLECGGNYNDFTKRGLNLSLAGNFERLQRILMFKKQKKDNLQNIFFNLPKKIAAERNSLLISRDSPAKVLILPQILKKESEKELSIQKYFH
jgi:hypothetical protein